MLPFCLFVCFVLISVGEPDDGGGLPPVPATIRTQLVSAAEWPLLTFVSTSAANQYRLGQVFLRLS